ncbi:hypothetical protein PQX77_004665 [Marasmius sp. AFHP31]|nr:hypothetical protein PQX77_004665 [Marasmius sp. AFHP31]
MAKKAGSNKQQASNDTARKLEATQVTPIFPPIGSKVAIPSHVILADQIILLDNFLNALECQAFIKMIEMLPLELTPPKKRGEAERVNYRFSVQSPAFAQKLFSLLLPHLPQLDTGNGIRRRPVACNSNIRMYKYTPSQHFGAHYDDSVVDLTTGYRSEWTILVYLSGTEDGVEGGETLFYKTEKRKPNDTITAPLTRGTALLHRHGQHCMLHEGSKVLKGIKAGQDGSLGNIANIIACGLSIFVVIGLVLLVERRKAAVGRVEFRFFLILYLLTLPFQLLTNGSLLEQGSTALVALTAIHAGLVATLFWSLLSNALVATQFVEDGTISSMLASPFSIFAIAFFAATTYISFDIGLGVTNSIGNPATNRQDLHSIPLFVLTSIWPGAAALIYFALMTYIVLAVLREVKPMVYYVMAAALFVLSQLAWFLLGRVVCSSLLLGVTLGSNAKVDGSFIATVLETGAVVALYFAWRSITEETWDDDYY